MVNHNKYNLTSESRTSIYFINFIQGMSQHHIHSIFQFGKMNKPKHSFSKSAFTQMKVPSS